MKLLIRIVKFPFQAIALLIRYCICRHEFSHYRNIHGDEINAYFPIKRSEWVCDKCGYPEMREKLYYGEEKQ